MPAPFSRYAHRISRDSLIAKEATQDVFLQAWRTASLYHVARGTVRGWLLVMARGRTLDLLRAGQARTARLCPLDGWLGVNDRDAGPSLETIWAASEDARRVKAALAVFPVTDRRLVDLAYFEGLTHTEIAAHLALPLGTVKTQMRRVLRLMRHAMVEQPARPFEWSADRSESAVRPAPLRNMNVVVVDDDPDTLRLLTLVLERAAPLPPRLVGGTGAPPRPLKMA